MVNVGKVNEMIYIMIKCSQGTAHEYTVSEKKELIAPIYFNTNYPTEMKLVTIIVVYCLLQFDALKCF